MQAEVVTLRRRAQELEVQLQKERLEHARTVRQCGDMTQGFESLLTKFKTASVR